MPDSRLDTVSIDTLRERLRRSTDADEVKRLVAAREAIAGKSPAAIAERYGWDEALVKSWLGLIERDGLEAGASPPESPPDRGSRSWFRVTLAVAIFVALFLAAVQGGFLAPGAVLDGRAGGVLGGSAGDVAGTPVAGSIQLSTVDVRYLNRIFREQSTEVAYCGVVDGQRLQPRLANLTYSDQSHARFTPRECHEQSEAEIAMIHTHPNGHPELSPGDREAFRDSEFVYTCVQHGRITTEKGAETSTLRCYERAGANGDLRRVPVRVTVPSA